MAMKKIAAPSAAKVLCSRFKQSNPQLDLLKSLRGLTLALSSGALGLALTVGLTSCTSLQKREVEPGPRVSVMTFNVENLFDTKHDAGTNDYTFLPLAAKQSPEAKAECNKNDRDYYRQQCLETDWNDDVLDKKLTRVAAVIQQINDGRGPDIQILAEVENENVLNMLRKRLPKADYKTSILIEGFDTRGIDVAILSRFPQWDKPVLHKIPFRVYEPEDQSRADHTRGILEARLLLPDGQKVSVFAVHFPAQGNPGYLRRQAAEYLSELQKGLPKDVLAIAGGDFNIAAKEEKDRGYFSKVLASNWLVSHIIGCKGCEGTEYYHGERQWSFFDALLFSPSMKPGAEGAAWKVDPASIRIPTNTRYQVSQYGNPARFDETKAFGVSDHWPMYAEIYKPASASAPAAAAPQK